GVILHRVPMTVGFLVISKPAQRAFDGVLGGLRSAVLHGHPQPAAAGLASEGSSAGSRIGSVTGSIAAAKSAAFALAAGRAVTDRIIEAEAAVAATARIRDIAVRAVEDVRVRIAARAVSIFDLGIVRLPMVAVDQLGIRWNRNVARIAVGIDG